jgi:hypothetical protein
MYPIDIVERVKTNERNSIKSAFPVEAQPLKARARKWRRPPARP